MTFLIRPAGARDLPEILAIYNHMIRTTSAIWKDEPVSLDERRAWFAVRQASGYPVLVADVADRVAGYAAVSDFRPGSGYRMTCENTVHVLPEFARRGIGRALLTKLVEEAREIGKTAMVAAIGLPNRASIMLHRACDFQESGILPGVGIKHGQRLDLLLMQRDL